MAALCGAGCGHCGRCTAPWEAEPDERVAECAHCGGIFLPEETGSEDYCSDDCADAEEGYERDDY